MPRDPNTILNCLAGGLMCVVIYATFRVLVYIGRLLWAKRAVSLDPVDAHLETAPRAYEESLHFDRWQAELLEEPAIRKYTRRMDRRPT